MRFIGIHLIQPLGEIASPSPSTLATLDDAGRLEGISGALHDHEILNALPDPPGVITLDAPVFVPNAKGRRGAEDLLAWCDINVFPASRERLGRLYGGLRGESLASRLEAEGYTVHESFPEVIVRQREWESRRNGLAPLDLARYREAWIGVKAPRYANKRDEPGTPEARRRALELLNIHDPDGRDQPGAIAALACAYAALRSARPDLGATLSLPVGGEREIVLPAGPELLSRAALHLRRLSSR